MNFTIHPPSTWRIRDELEGKPDQFKINLDVFLANVNTKQNFINMLRRYLRYSGCQTKTVSSDTDLLIVQTTVQYVTKTNTVLVGVI